MTQTPAAPAKPVQPATVTQGEIKPPPPGLQPGAPERLDAPDLPAGEPRGAPRAERPGEAPEGALKMHDGA